jgi:hypothetical protein
MDSCSLSSIMQNDGVQDGMSMSSCFRLFNDAGALSSYVPSSDMAAFSPTEPNAHLAMQARGSSLIVCMRPEGFTTPLCSFSLISADGPCRQRNRVAIHLAGRCQLQRQAPIAVAKLFI